MTIKILKRGTPPQEVVYKAKCSKCNSELEYQKEDVLSFESSPRNESYHNILCPVCYATFYNEY